MPIAAGSRLGPYEIVSRIGAGGMGEVWRARDTRLDRSVAIKILPAELAHDATFRIRFEREARTISQLNHPHICTLHDVGEEFVEDERPAAGAAAGSISDARKATRQFLVMEFLEGESLADRLARGQMSLPDVLKYGVQIAEALDRAHRSGIVHRDLKPGNVMITKTGAKLLDFGLAKSSGASFLRPTGTTTEIRPVDQSESAPAALGGATNLATEARPLTAEGTVLGTFQYMAPEQLEGVDADPRTDIFSLGAVLYEMASGKRAFEGKTRTSLVAAILGAMPTPVSELRSLTPPALEHLIAKCLAKDPDDRWQSAHDVAEELRWIGEGGSQTLAIHAPRRSTLKGVAMILMAAAIGALASWAAIRANKPRPPVMRAFIRIPPDAPIAPYGPHRIVVSPDGKFLVYVSDRGGAVDRGSALQLMLRPLDRLDPAMIPGTDGATSPFFSPDSQWIGFFSGKQLQRISTSGGAIQPICETLSVQSATWSGGSIVFTEGRVGLHIVPAIGGVPQSLPNTESARNPEALDDGDHLLASNGDSISAYSISTHQWKKLLDVPGPSRVQYLRNGHLLYNRGTALLLAPFDAKTLTLTGPSTTVVDEVTIIPPYSVPLFSASDNGLLVYSPGSRTFANTSLVWVDRGGEERPVSAVHRPFEEPRLSPDGKKIAMTIRGEPIADIWLQDLTRGALTRFTFDAAEEETPLWSPDGKWIAYAADRKETHGIYLKLADGSDQETPLVVTRLHSHVNSWSPDSKSLVFTDYNLGFGGDVMMVSLKDKSPVPLVQTAFNERAARISPDARWMAYVSDESGRSEVYVQSYPRPGAKFQVSIDGGREPVWSPRGNELFYRSGERMISVEVTTSPAFSAGTPKVVFERPYAPSRRGDAAYDVSADGQRFLMVKRDAETYNLQLVMASNWMSTD
jgi:serine/threonine protein kinase